VINIYSSVGEKKTKMLSAKRTSNNYVHQKKQLKPAHDNHRSYKTTIASLGPWAGWATSRNFTRVR